MNEIKYLLECIAKFDSTETLETKGKYFETIQKDAQRLIKLFAIPDVSSSVCSCGSTNYGYGFAKCFDCGKIKDV